MEKFSKYNNPNFFFTFDEAVFNYKYLKFINEKVIKINYLVLCESKFSYKRLVANLFIFGLYDFLKIILINLYWNLKGGRCQSYAVNNEIKVIKLNNLNKFKFNIRKNIGISVNFELIFRAEHIKKFKTLLNVHHSLLPLNSGLMPIYYSLKNKKPIGTSIHLISEKIDSGQLLFQKKINKYKRKSVKQIWEELDKISFNFFLNLKKNKFSYKKIRKKYIHTYNSSPKLIEAVKFYLFNLLKF